MATPALVFNEPAVTGALRVELYGDAARAGAQLGTARAVLGALRCMYGVNERIADGEPGGFYMRAVTLADGTRIEAFTNNGLDMVRIHAPAAPAAAPRRAAKRRRVIRKSVLACGYWSFVADQDLQSISFFWREGDVAPAVIAAPGSDAVHRCEAQGVSPTGVVCGFTLRSNTVDNITTTSNEAWRWRAETGYAVLAHDAAAYALSEDGAMVAGAAAAGACYWDRNGTQVPLAAPYGGGQARAMSADGRRIVGVAGGGSGPLAILLWVDGAMQLLSQFGGPPFIAGYGGLCMSRDGTVLAWSERGGVEFVAMYWSAQDGLTAIASDFMVRGLSDGGGTVYLSPISDDGGTVLYQWTPAGGLTVMESLTAHASNGELVLGGVHANLIGETPGDDESEPPDALVATGGYLGTVDDGQLVPVVATLHGGALQLYPLDVPASAPLISALAIKTTDHSDPPESQP
jgi:hypothetical protein